MATKKVTTEVFFNLEDDGFKGKLDKANPDNLQLKYRKVKENNNSYGIEGVMFYSKEEIKENIEPLKAFIKVMEEVTS